MTTSNPSAALSRPVAMLGLGLLALAIAATLIFRAQSADSFPDLVINGETMQSDSFSIATVVDPLVRETVELAQWENYRECMSAKGFTELTHASDDAVADAQAVAAFGSLAGARMPQVTDVDLPNGETWRLETFWGEDGCTYQSHASLGVDPFEREALRQVMSSALVAADVEASKDSEISGLISRCRDRGVSDADVFATVDGRLGQPPTVSALISNCVTSDEIAQIRLLRSAIHYRVAVDYAPVLTAWAQTVEHQLATLSG